MKTCNKCGKSKPFSDFNKDVKGTYGLRADCRPCKNARARELKALKTGKPIPETKPEISEAEKLRRQARVAALRQLAEIHFVEYKRLFVTELSRLGAPKRWNSVA